jgi:hypothetical protein
VTASQVYAAREAALTTMRELHPTFPGEVVALLMALTEDHLAPVRLTDNGSGTATSYALGLASRFPKEAAIINAWLETHLTPDRICGECGLLLRGDVSDEDISELESAFVFAFTFKGFEYAFICDWCMEKWKCFEERGLPNFYARLDAKNNGQPR